MRLIEALSTRRNFVLYRLVLNADGKLDKIPTHPVDGITNIDGQNPENWLLPADAQALADAWTLTPAPGVSGYGVGIVIAPGTQLAFIDFDHARDGNGGWMPHVHAFESRFPGAYTETSISRGGRHILCSYSGELPAHGTRNKTYRMECYTRLRFMAIGDIEPQGDPSVDCTKALTQFITEYFPSNAFEPGEWRDGPVAEWKGPDNDDELLRRAMHATGLAKAFKGEAQFRDLWNNTDTVSHTYAGDESAADQALINHLSFWTGADCERILRLLSRDDCLMRRDKWLRDDYLPRTIMRAVSDSLGFYREREDEVPAPPLTVTLAGFNSVPAPPGVPAPPPPPAMMPEAAAYVRGQRPPSSSIVTIAQMQQIFDGYTYVADIDRMQFPNGNTANKARFDNLMGGAQFCLTADGQKPTKSAWDAFTLNEMYDFPRAETQMFRPDLPTGEMLTRGRVRLVNSYYPATIRRVQGDPSPFLDFAKRLLPNGRDAEILLCYMAATARYLGRKFAWAPFIQGTKGNGKTTIGRVLEYCCSDEYTHWGKAKELSEKYNAHYQGKILVVIDEMYSDDKTEFQEILKELVTSTRIEVRAMYADKLMKDVCFNLLLISNHQNGVRIDANERRYAPLFCAQQAKSDLARDGLTKQYFRDLNAWLNADGFAIVYDYLLGLEIPEEFDPTKLALHAPDTTSTDAAALASLGGIEQEIANAIEGKQPGFKGGWVSEHAVDMLLARLGKDKFTPRTLRRSMILALGFEPHPALVDGICDEPLPEGVRTRIYIRKGHPWAVTHLSAAQVRDGYVEHQK